MNIQVRHQPMTWVLCSCPIYTAVVHGYTFVNQLFTVTDMSAQDYNEIANINLTITKKCYLRLHVS